MTAVIDGASVEKDAVIVAVRFYALPPHDASPKRFLPAMLQRPAMSMALDSKHLRPILPLRATRRQF